MKARDTHTFPVLPYGVATNVKERGSALERQLSELRQQVQARQADIVTLRTEREAEVVALDSAI